MNGALIRGGFDSAYVKVVEELGSNGCFIFRSINFGQAMMLCFIARTNGGFESVFVSCCIF